MRLELWNDVGPDGPEVWACVDDRRMARVDWTHEGYHVRRDDVPPELEHAVRSLEDGPGSDGPLAEGEIRGIDQAYPSFAAVAKARAMPPAHRPHPNRFA